MPNMRAIIITILFFPLYANAQKFGDDVINVAIKDSGLYYTKIALIQSDFIVKDLPGDSLVTYPREFNATNYVVAFVKPTAEGVAITGVWGRRMLNVMGFMDRIRDFERVYYFKNNDPWVLLNNVAKRMGLPISYTKK